MAGGSGSDWPVSESVGTETGTVEAQRVGMKMTELEGGIGGFWFGGIGTGFDESGSVGGDLNWTEVGFDETGREFRWIETGSVGAQYLDLKVVVSGFVGSWMVGVGWCLFEYELVWTGTVHALVVVSFVGPDGGLLSVWWSSESPLAVEQKKNTDFGVSPQVNVQ